MKILIISANTFRFSPSGPAYVAGAATAAGHIVEIFDCLFADNTIQELERHITRFNPDIIGISIRTVAGIVYNKDAEFYMKPFDNRILVRDIVECIKKTTHAEIVLGGPGFNYYGADWLEYLDLDYGIRGEAEFSFPEYLNVLEEGGDIKHVPGSIFRENGRFFKTPRERVKNLDDTALPAYELFDLDKYVENNIAAGIFTKRGCAFQCTFCPHSSLEGTRYRLKSPTRVVDEIAHIKKADESLVIQFCDNCFNAPWKHAKAICKEIIRRKIDIKWNTIALKPIGITDDILRLFKDSGCVSLSLSTETASEKMLKNMYRGYLVEQVRESLSCLVRSDIPFMVYLLFGAPGETPETIDETLTLIDSYQVPNVYVTVGISLWTHHQKVYHDLRNSGQLPKDENLFDEMHYISPGLPKDYMIDLINDLSKRDNYTVQAFKPFSGYK